MLQTRSEQATRRPSASPPSTARPPVALLQQAKDAKIPVIGFDSGVDSDIPVTTVATDNIAAAGVEADKLAELIGDAGKVARRRP